MKFDYVLIGGGTAACVVARQLLDRKLGTVAIIESGEHPRGPRIFTPVRYTETFASDWDYGLSTEPQKNLANRRLVFPRGRMLGGSSGNNAMIYIPPTMADFASWPEEWKYDQLLPAIRDVEEQLFLCDSAIPEIHPLSKRFLRSLSEYNQRISQSKISSLPYRENQGFEPIRFRQTQHQGRRRGAYSAFLKPELQNPSLTIFKKSDATRILFRDNKAFGVEFQSGERKHVAEASVAVVLSAGTVASPQILMQSGIGPRESLSEIGIETRIDLPGVGANLQDHLIVPLVFEAKNCESLEKEFSNATRLEYLKYRTGAKTSNIAEVGAFYKVINSFPKASQESHFPNIQIHFTPTHYLEYPSRRAPANAWTIGVTQCNPLSRGSIRLAKNGESNWKVEIDPNYLYKDCDLEILLSGVREALQLVEQPTLTEVRGKLLLPRSNRKEQELSISIDDEALIRHIKRYALTLYHPVGTCAIGSGEQLAVVDSDLSVRGTENLFVADASIIPTLPKGNPQSMVMMIGYKMSEILQNRCN